MVRRVSSVSEKNDNKKHSRKNSISETKKTTPKEDKNKKNNITQKNSSDKLQIVAPRTRSQRKKSNIAEQISSLSKTCSFSKKSSDIEQRFTRSKGIRQFPVIKSISASEISEKIEPRATRSTTLQERENRVLKTVLPEQRLHKKERLVATKRHDFFRLTNYELNSIVLAKQKYSIPWPARVLKIEKEKVQVHFFGDQRSGYVNSSEIYDFEKSVDAIKYIISSNRKPRGYLNGLREIELLLGVTEKNSVIKNL